MTAIRDKWDGIYARSAADPEACELLQSHEFLLPAQGTALDLACGLGGNALLLAERGLSVCAWDVSGIAIERLRFAAATRGLAVAAECVDIGPESLPKSAFDVITVSRFLDRALGDAIMAALKPGGLLFYQTYTQDKLDNSGPNNPDFLLKPNELLRLFATLRLVFYQEFGMIGDTACGDRNQARLIAQNY